MRGPSAQVLERLPPSSQRVGKMETRERERVCAHACERARERHFIVKATGPYTMEGGGGVTGEGGG